MVHINPLIGGLELQYSLSKINVPICIYIYTYIYICDIYVYIYIYESILITPTSTGASMAFCGTLQVLVTAGNAVPRRHRVHLLQRWRAAREPVWVSHGKKNMERSTIFHGKTMERSTILNGKHRKNQWNIINYDWFSMGITMVN